MQDDRGLKKLLTVPWVYDAFQNLLGAHGARQWIAERQWKLSACQKVVDVGCGTGDALNYIPADVTYVGYDISEEYILAARKRFQNRRATFLVSTARQLLDRPDDRFLGADLVIGNGILHHLEDDEVLDILELSRQILKPAGRMICIEPAYLECQSRLSHWIMSQDRGCNIRTEQEWKRLIERVFGSFQTKILTNLIRIPYTHILIEGQQANPARAAA